MESYNKNILIINDKVEELKDKGFLSFLQPKGFKICWQPEPEVGLILASHKYSIIFIDFKFDNSVQYTGTSLCYAIREKCPLSTIILLTAYGKENIEKFSHAPWDGYIDKEQKGVKIRQLNSTIQNRITEAIEIRTNKISILSKIPNETKAIDDKKTILNKLEKLYNDKPESKNWDDTSVAHQLEYKSRAALSQKFTCRNKETKELKKEALIFRHVLMNNPDAWKLAKDHYGPLKNLVAFFSV